MSDLPAISSRLSASSHKDKQLPKGMAEANGKLILVPAFLNEANMQLSYYNSMDGIVRGCLIILDRNTPENNTRLDALRRNVFDNIKHLTAQTQNKHLILEPLLDGINQLTTLSIIEGVAVIKPEFFSVPTLAEKIVEPDGVSLRRLD